MTIWVLTISDRASQGVYADRAGPAVMEELERLLSPPPRFFYRCVPDGYDSVLTALTEAMGLSPGVSPRETTPHPEAKTLSEVPPDWLITVGGTGIGPRDQTPEATQAFIEGGIPGLAEYLRQKSLEETVFAVFSRGIAGYRGSTLIVNFPGSERAARFYARQLAPLMDHAIRMRRGEGH